MEAAATRATEAAVEICETHGRMQKSSRGPSEGIGFRRVLAFTASYPLQGTSDRAEQRANTAESAAASGKPFKLNPDAQTFIPLLALAVDDLPSPKADDNCQQQSPFDQDLVMPLAPPTADDAQLLEDHLNHDTEDKPTG